MASQFLRRRKVLTFLGLGTVGLGAAIASQSVGQSTQTRNPNFINSGQDPVKRDASLISSKTLPLPEFSGASTWLNSPPLTRSNLQGQVVLVQFCTFACINWQHTLPHIQKWHQEFADRGLQIIGIHSPEFAFERDLGNVRQALAQRSIQYPVAIDNDYKLWRAYHNEYWPHLFLANRQGMIQYDHIGEGAYAETEQKIRELLG